MKRVLTREGGPTHRRSQRSNTRAASISHDIRDGARIDLKSKRRDSAPASVEPAGRPEAALRDASDPVAVPVDEIVPLKAAVLRRLSRIDALTDDVLLTSTEVRQALGMLNGARGYLLSSLESLDSSLEYLEVQPVEEPGKVPPTRREHEAYLPIKSAAQKARLDVTLVREQETSLGEALERLSMQEYRLQKKHRALQRDLAESKEDGLLLRGLPDISMPSTRARSASTPEGSLPSVVEAYFDRVGDVGIYQERLNDLDLDHAEGIVDRDMIADREETVEVSDADFKNNYTEKRLAIEEDLALARIDANELGEICRTQGYDVERYRGIKQRTETGSILESTASRVEPQRSSQLQLGRLDAALSEGDSAPRPPAGNVRTWLSGVRTTDDDEGIRDLDLHLSVPPTPHTEEPTEDTVEPGDALDRNLLNQSVAETRASAYHTLVEHGFTPELARSVLIRVIPDDEPSRPLSE